MRKRPSREKKGQLIWRGNWAEEGGSQNINAVRTVLVGRDGPLRRILGRKERRGEALETAPSARPQEEWNGTYCLTYLYPWRIRGVKSW